MPNDVNEKRKTIAAAAASAGASSGSGDLAEPGGRTGAERRRRLGHARIEIRPERPDDPHDDGDVEERVRDQDRNPPALDAVGEDREERERHDHRREHERDDDERADEVASTESVATENVGRGERDEDRQRGRRERLPDGEPHDLARQRIGEDVERRISRPAQSALDDGGERIEEEERQERERNAVRDDPPGAGAHRTTMSVHSSTQRSRFASISAGGSSRGCFGTTANRSNSGGRAASRTSREHEHLQRDVLLEALREHEVDELAGALRVPRSPQHSGELDLAKARARHDTGGRVGRSRVAEDHLRGRARCIGDDHGTLALAARCAGEASVVGVLPAVHDEHVVRAELAPVALPAVAELRDRRQHEREARRRGRRVLDDEEPAVARQRQVGERSRAAPARGSRTTPCRS